MYLTKNYEELMAAQNDDVMIGLLKNKINALENTVEETEKKYEAQIHTLKRALNESTKESNKLRMQIKDLELQLDTPRQQDSSVMNTSQEKMEKLQRQLAEKDETLIKLANENITLDSKYHQIKMKMQIRGLDEDGREMVSGDMADNGADRDGTVEEQEGPAWKKTGVRKRNAQRDTAAREVGAPMKTEISPETLKQLQGDDELKRIISELVEEKTRLEKINTELSKKMLELKKNVEEDRDKEVQKEKKKAELMNASLKRELEENKQLREENEKKLLSKIRMLEKKVEERESQFGILKKGMESLEKDMKLMKDPSRRAGQHVASLEKFASYNTEFVEQEIKRLREDIVKLKDETKFREKAVSGEKENHTKLVEEYQKAMNELQLKKELLEIRDEELMSANMQNINLIQSMEMVRQDKVKVSNLTKLNNEYRNQLIHMRALTRRLGVGTGAGNVSLVGVDTDQSKDKAGAPPPLIKAGGEMDYKALDEGYGFGNCVKDFAEASIDEVRIKVMQRVAFVGSHRSATMSTSSVRLSPDPRSSPISWTRPWMAKILC